MIAWGSRQQKNEEEVNVASQLLALRDFAAKYGVLHDAQILQLKLWPRVAFPHSTADTVAEVSLIEKMVTVKVVSTRKTNKTKTRALMLTRNIRWMLGNEWSVDVYENDKLLLKKAGQKSVEYTGTDFGAGKLVPRKPWKFQSQTQPLSK